MLRAWILLLLWGLLPFSQGIVENVLSLAQLDKSVLENVASDTLAKGDLLGGGLGGLLGGGGGDLLGGLVGGVLGGQGGLLDGVLGGQGGGLVGGVLGGQGGPLDGVLGGQGGGLVGSVLGGQGGLLGGVLGGQGGGLVGGVLGGQGGPLDGVLGGQGGGLVGGVLGGQGGPLGGVLGGQGGDLVGGVLGGQGGPLDGVLGGQGGGLVGGLAGGQGGLLDGVLGGQGGGLVGGVLGGQGGLLGGQGGLLGGLLGGSSGLVGGLLGGQGPVGGLTGGHNGGLLGGLLGLKLVDIRLPQISLKLRKGVGIDLNVYTKVEVNMPLLTLLNLLVEVNITAQTRMVRDASGAPRLVVQNCKTLMSGVKLKSELLKPLDGVVGNLLNNLLPGVLCPVIELVVNVLNTLLGTINSICPFGVLGQLHYTLAGLPVFQDQHILLNLNLMITDLEGKKTINLPPVRLPVLPEPAAGDHVSQLVLPGELISTLIGSLGSKGLLNADITQQTLRGNVPMTTSALQSLIPAISLLGVPSLPLVVRIRLNELPRVSLQNGEVFVSLATSIEVLAHTRFGSKQLFELAATVGLSGKITPGLAKLSITLSLKSLNLRVASSVLGSINVGVLQGWITNLLVSEYLPILNGALEIGIPLPKLFNLNFDDAAVSVVQNALVVGTTPKLH